MKQCALPLAITLSVPLLSQSFRAERVTNPAGSGSLQPDRPVAPVGSAIVSWLEQRGQAGAADPVEQVAEREC